MLQLTPAHLNLRPDPERPQSDLYTLRNIYFIKSAYDFTQAAQLTYGQTRVSFSEAAGFHLNVSISQPPSLL